MVRAGTRCGALIGPPRAHRTAVMLSRLRRRAHVTCQGCDGISQTKCMDPCVREPRWHRESPNRTRPWAKVFVEGGFFVSR